MNNSIVEQGWQELEARIEQLHRKYFSEPRPEPDQRPGDILCLSEMRAKYGEERSETK